MNGMYGMPTAEQLIAINHMQVAANHAVPSGAMPFQEVLRVYGEDQITGVGSCIDYEKRKIKRIGKLRIHSIHHCYIDKDGQRKEFLYVSYSSMDDSTHLAVVPCDKLASKNLLPPFESCKCAIWTKFPSDRFTDIKRTSAGYCSCGGF